MNGPENIHQDDEQNERYVSIPVNNFYELPRSKAATSGIEPVTKLFSIVLYFSSSDDNFSWICNSMNFKIPLIIFENASPSANILSYLYNYVELRSKSYDSSKKFDEKLRAMFNSDRDMNSVREILPKLCELFHSLKGKGIYLVDPNRRHQTLAELPVFIAEALKSCENMNEPTTFFRLLFQLNIPSLLKNIKTTENCINSHEFYELFEEALKNPTKDGFVKWLLDEGIKINSFLTADRFVRLFKFAKPNDFFNNVVLGNLLGKKFVALLKQLEAFLWLNEIFF